MTNLEHHVTNLELSKRLKELGVPQMSYFEWSIPKGNHELSFLIDPNAATIPENDYCSAFLASELGEMLPPFSVTERILDKWTAEALEGGTDKQYAFTEPDARAKLLILLIEQGIVDPKTLKKENLS